MIEIVADTLEEAYAQAAKALDSSIVDLEIEVIQAPSRGILGLFKKTAIIQAVHKNAKKTADKITTQKKSVASVSSDSLSPTSDIHREIASGIEALLGDSCFQVALVELKVEDDLVSIMIDGEDAALMIGKEGYRYKALSYVLHNWIKIKFDKNITLEIAQFLHNQTQMIEEYLESIISRVESTGKAQTKPLDGILVKLALEKLRERFPEKYVAIRNIKDGRKIVIVNAYRK